MYARTPLSMHCYGCWNPGVKMASSRNERHRSRPPTDTRALIYPYLATYISLIVSTVYGTRLHRPNANPICARLPSNFYTNASPLPEG
ncbi:hypothetical protein BD309DRAFT_60607 [Dichomitus squalens]|nr:hypothetical protein BD309DRAFT_60607 [Dichomitus squalens]